MDPASHHHDPSQQNAGPNTPSSSRKRSRENETPSQRHKREKAAERQRRKRERDRQAGLSNILALSQVQQPSAPPVVEQQAPLPQSISDYGKGDDISVEEVAKRDRVRAAARERQRKHRALVKARKMRELGMDMGNELMPGMEEVQYQMGADGQYQPVMPHEMRPHPHAQPMHEPPFPQGALIGGQTFASTLLLSFSCAPLLKQHLLRTLNMTNEELASLEPIIAQAWDHWDQQRRIHYAHQAANGHKAPDGTNVADPAAASYPPGITYVHDPSQAPQNDFRARFHRPLVAPSPFRSAIVSAAESQQPSASSAPSTSASGSAPVGPSGDTMDPHMSTTNPGEQRPTLLSAVAGIDPELGQARDEAAGVAGKLERS